MRDDVLPRRTRAERTVRRRHYAHVSRSGLAFDKEPLVGDAYWGVGLLRGKWQLTYTYVVRSKEFKPQREVNQFGSITISRAF